MENEEIRALQIAHWKQMLQENPDSPQAVGSESWPHKSLRYKRIAGIFSHEKSEPSARSRFSIHDIGCGTGDFLAYLRSEGNQRWLFNYSGSDITEEYLQVARVRFPNVDFQRRNFLDSMSAVGHKDFDYVVLSEVFHQHGGAAADNFQDYMFSLLSAAWAITAKGLAFNVLLDTAEYRKEGNYYCNLNLVNDFVGKRLTRFFRVDTITPLFEATFHCLKPEFVAGAYQDTIFRRYF